MACSGKCDMRVNRVRSESKERKERKNAKTRRYDLIVGMDAFNMADLERRLEP